MEKKVIDAETVLGAYSSYRGPLGLEVGLRSNPLPKWVLS